MRRPAPRLYLLVAAAAAAAAAVVSSYVICPAAAAAPVLPPAQHLRVEYLPEVYALAVGTSTPRFSWTTPLVPGSTGKEQTGYRILVVDTRANEPVWDSGVVQSNGTTLVPYGGPKPLAVDGSFRWNVTWYSGMESSGASKQQVFGIGPLSESDWHGAKWVGDDQSRLVRLELPDPDTSGWDEARLYVAAPGCVSVFVNGVPVRETRSGICPWTHFNSHRTYTAIDLAPLVRRRNNVVGLMLGKSMFGRYAKQPSTFRAFASLRSVGATAPVIVATNTDQLLSTSTQSPWSFAPGPFIADDPFDGTEIDWKSLPLGWSTAGFDPAAATGWTVGLPPRSSPAAAGSANLVALGMPPAVDRAAFKPVSTSYLPREYGGGVHVFDFGRNIVGTCSISATAASINSTVVLRHGEMLLANGSLNLNYSGHDTGVKAHFQRDVHRLRSPGATDTNYRSIFTWYGFQYVSIQLLEGAAFAGPSPGDSITCYQMYPDFDTQELGNVHFTDDEHSAGAGAALNTIQELVVTSQYGNLANYAPTDCPTREKHFWLGDAQVTAEEAMLNIGPQITTLYNNFLRIISDEQGAPGGRKLSFDVPGVVPNIRQGDAASQHLPGEVPGGVSPGIATDISWSAAYPLIAGWIGSHFTDSGPAHQHYASIKSLLEGLCKTIDSNSTSSEICLPDFFTWGDWCSMQPRAVATPATGPAAAAFNWLLSVDAAASLAAHVAPQDVPRWEQLAEKGRQLWHKHFYNADQKAYGYYNGDDFVVQTLTAAPLALGDVIPEPLRARVLGSLLSDVKRRGYHLTFGSVGAKHVLPQLTRNGLHEAAMRMATVPTYPSFMYWVSQGATSCWENWSGVADSEHPPQPTHNHIFLCGGVGEWMYREVVGLLPSEMRVRPHVSAASGPAAARGRVFTVRGPLAASWSRTFKANAQTLQSFNLNVSLPFTGTVQVPTLGTGVSGVSVVVWGDQGTPKLVWNRTAVRPPPAVAGLISVDASSSDEEEDSTARVNLRLERGNYRLRLTVLPA